jgi:hypothetical protein
MVLKPSSLVSALVNKALSDRAYMSSFPSTRHKLIIYKHLLRLY